MPSLSDKQLLRWLRPGMHVKRWLGLLVLGVAIMGLGISYLLREAYLTYTFPGVAYYLTLQFIPRYLRGMLFVGMSGWLLLTALWNLNRALLAPFLENNHGDPIAVRIYNHHARQRGPRVVAIGGGTGLSMLLSGLKEHSSNLTAIVTVADDGGSSGRLRREMGVLPPGDLRNCIAALAEAEPLMRSLFQYRFSEGSGLEGHSFGNLFIVAMSGVTGNFEEAIRATSRVLNVRGQILPSTLANVSLTALTDTGERIHGESRITEAGRPLREIFIEPADARAYPEAIDAIGEADMIVVGPGSLFTSILPNLLVHDIREAIEASEALKVYVCNVATQRGETDSFTVADHIRVLERHLGRRVFHHVLANNNVSEPLPPTWHSEPVSVNGAGAHEPRLVVADVISEDNRYRHNPQKLARALMRIYDGRSPISSPSPVEDELVF
ncbi:MAG TPA: gluconeogenesis factor YvcK family protein [Dehalococcoidia bacterium]|nr:gluconeogenesis factor YvcK family protein [Dehalococcoidia bacterium]